MRGLGIFLILLSCAWAQWVMFADPKDTYIYNTQTGEIYIRHRKKGKNYEDVFVKMPRGMRPEELGRATSQGIQSKEAKDEKTRLESLKKSQEMLDEALKGL